MTSFDSRSRMTARNLDSAEIHRASAEARQKARIADVEMGAQQEVGVRLDDDGEELGVRCLGAEIAVDGAHAHPLGGEHDIVLLAGLGAALDGTFGSAALKRLARREADFSLRRLAQQRHAGAERGKKRCPRKHGPPPVCDFLLGVIEVQSFSMSAEGKREVSWPRRAVPIAAPCGCARRRSQHRAPRPIPHRPRCRHSAGRSRWRRHRQARPGRGRRCGSRRGEGRECTMTLPPMGTRS